MPLAQFTVSENWLVTVLSRQAVEGKIVAVAAGLQNELSHFPVEFRIHQNRSLCRIPIVRVVWRGLVIPSHLAGIDVDRNNGTGEQVVAFAAALRRVRRRRVSRPHNVKMSLR